MSIVRNDPFTVLGKATTASTEKVDPLDQPNAPYIGLEHIERDVGTISGQGTAADVKSTKAVFRKGDLLYGKLRPYLNKVWVAQFDGVCSTDILVFPQSGSVDNSFLKYRFMSSDFVRFASENSNGVNLPRVNAKALARFPLWLPQIDEQRRIVAEIEQQFTRLDAGVSALRRTQANLKRYRAAVLKAACEGRLVPTEAGWPIKPISAAIASLDQGWSPKCESEPSNSPETWAVIKTTAIQPLHFLENENKSLPTALKPRPHLAIQAGDVLITRAGPRTRVGVACAVKSSRPRLMLCDKAYRLRCKHDVATPAFIELALNAPHIVDALDKLKTGISDSGLNLTQNRFNELQIPFPSLAEQTRIVAEVERRLSVVDELEFVVKFNLQRATRLRQSILTGLFNFNAHTQ